MIIAGTKRKVFFSFHYRDIFRVNVVRLSGEFAKIANDKGRDVEGFYDRSLWESKEAESKESLKALIREGVHNTSAVCVLIGSKTWQRPWVRYEIARGVVDGKGLLGVHINSIRHHETQKTETAGDNPFRYLGIALREDDNHYLCERRPSAGGYVWEWYDGYTKAVPLPKFMKKPKRGSPLRLSEFVTLRDWSADGAKNIGSWIDSAAVEVGR